MQSKDVEADRLAQVHYEIEAGITQIFRIISTHDREDRVEEPIKLLEVNEDTVAAGIVPLQFAAAPAEAVPFASIIVEITPAEYEKLSSRELALPDGWSLGTAIPRKTPLQHP